MTYQEFEAQTYAEYEIELEKDGSLEWSTYFDNAVDQYNDIKANA